MSNKFSEWLMRWLFSALLRFFSKLPYRLVAQIGSTVGLALYYLPSRRKKILHTNLSLCFPEWSLKKRQEIAKAHCQQVIRSYFERGFQWFLPAKDLAKLIQVDSAIDLKNSNLPPTIFLFFHFVGLEAASIYLNCLLDRHCGSVYSRFTNPAVEAIALRQRERFQGEMIQRSNRAAFGLIRLLKKKQPIILAADMDFGIQDSQFVPFFGIPACTLTSVSRLARAAKAQVVPFTCEVLPNYQGYKMKIFAPWENYPTDDIFADTRRMNQFLEEQIITMPEQYYWIHRRFKTRPSGEASFYG